jgi:hypothetical protein
MWMLLTAIVPTAMYTEISYCIATFGGKNASFVNGFGRGAIDALCADIVSGMRMDGTVKVPRSVYEPKLCLLC